MLLHTPLYLVFLAIIYLIYWSLPRRRWQIVLLLAASYIFYTTFDWHFTLLLLALTIVTYRAGLSIAQGRRARVWLWIGVGVNLGILGLFKYANFFVDSAAAALRLIGVQGAPSALNLLLPIGISFYTFQAISYLIEIRRQRIPPLTSFVNLAVYLAFFPKLIAGPIVRPGDFDRQLVAPAPRRTPAMKRAALGLLLTGLIKKLLIADSLGSLADIAFRAANTGQTGFPTPLYWQGFYLFAFQIYADFSGYTDLARASAALLGFTLPENFQRPYFALTIADFWNRWHMSLTRWFREYLFFPLSRRLLRANNQQNPRMIQVIANLITMTLIGLWHGASWTFVLWGLWHGLLLSGYRVLNIQPQRRWQTILSAIVTFHLVGIGWVIFRAPTLNAAANFFRGLFTFQQLIWLPDYLPSILVTACLVFGVDWLTVELARQRLRNIRSILVVAAVVVIAALMLLNLARGGDTHPYLYGQF